MPPPTVPMDRPPAWPPPPDYPPPAWPPPTGPPPGYPPEPPRRPRGHRVAAVVAALVIAAGVLTIGRAATDGRTISLTSVPARHAPITTPIDGVVDVSTVLGYQNAAAAGTGLVLTGSGLILTNNHVIAGSTTIKVTDTATGKNYRASIVGYDVSRDIAVLSLRGASGLKPAPLGDSGTVALGDPVTAIGNAGGVGGRPSVVTGAVTALDQPITAGDSASGTSERLTGLIETSAPLKPGDSGGPLVSTSGRVIGIDTAMATGFGVRAGDSQGFAIPINRALSIASRIRGGQGSSTIHIGLPGFIGVNVQSAFGTSGATVTSVVPNSPAEQAGLGQGDVIVSLDGASIGSATALTDLMQRHHPGDEVRVGWADPTGAPHTTTLRLVTGPAA